MNKLLSFIRRCAWCGLGVGQSSVLCPSCESFWQARCIDETLLLPLYDFPVHRLFISKDHLSKERELAVLLKGNDQSRLWRHFAELFLQQRLLSHADLPHNPILVSAPSSTGRDHALLFAEALSQITGWPHDPYFKKGKVAQKSLMKQERLKRQLQPNHQSEFTGSVIFVDDLIVTGGTAQAADASIVCQHFEVWTLIHQLLLH